jgi:hypothetical protein
MYLFSGKNGCLAIYQSAEDLHMKLFSNNDSFELETTDDSKNRWLRNIKRMGYGDSIDFNCKGELVCRIQKISSIEITTKATDDYVTA